MSERAPAGGQATRGGRRRAWWTATLAAALFCSLAGWGLPAVSAAAVGPLAGGVGNVETVSPDEVAPEDRDVRADAPTPSPRAAPPPRPAPGGRERGDLASFADELRRLWGAIPAYSPVGSQSRLTSGFGWRASPFTGRREFHGGIDLVGPRGTRIVAPADGIVERAFVDDGAGLVVVLNHGNGIQTLYGHLDRVLVWEGKDVARGEPIGVLGNTGSRSTGPHLHYAIKVEGRYVNPRRYLFEKENPAPRAAK